MPSIIPTELGWYPLHIAVGAGDSDEVRRIVAAGFDVNTPTATETSLGIAAGINNVGMIDTLASLGIDMDRAAPATGHTPLVLAILKSQVKTVERLLSWGANPVQPNALGMTPLSTAMGKAHLGTIRALVKSIKSQDQPVDLETWEECAVSLATHGKYKALAELIPLDLPILSERGVERVEHAYTELCPSYLRKKTSAIMVPLVNIARVHHEQRVLRETMDEVAHVMPVEMPPSRPRSRL